MGTPSALSYAQRLGISGDVVVQEIGWDEDAETAISEDIEDAIGCPLLDEDATELCDVVLLWFRSDDGDLVDALVDASRNLSDGGKIWLMTPSPHAPGGVQPGEVSESAKLAGFVPTKVDRLGSWQGACLTSTSVKK
ncbi:DUF3052 domain-containing protein [Corynebacterium liangguodongii]|uniref:DUF3052 domain-containing protein n=1 Tax=Corynebacterium liangguodongii TaxID=2079535 RepID=A0A2S0WF76_9CORY|nr:DUF3052 domain-containing protein [Corynebacterium liangguodongii]AWB84419.1 DUF3052 domain-containing protein [Corynebacterium liangguodongii]PWB99909.1 DUF3052 domain-containing protein [Corynebacterium liangguodongii]